MVRDLARLVSVAIGFPLIVATGAPIAGCIDFTRIAFDHRGPDLGPEHTGMIGLELDVGSGVALNSVNYAISGNGFSKEGFLDVSQSPVLAGVIDGIPAGDGFTIVITATTPDGTLTCVGTATFSIREDMITKVNIALECRFNRRTGNIDVKTDVNLCPVIEELIATPIETTVGGTITLATRIGDSDGSASSLDLTFDNGITSLAARGRASSAIALTCTSPGPDRIKLTVSDGKCLQMTIIDVMCSGGASTAPSKAEWTWHELGGAP